MKSFYRCKKYIVIILFCHVTTVVHAQVNAADSGMRRQDSTIQWHTYKGVSSGYSRPRSFSFIRNLPHDAGQIAVAGFRKPNRRYFFLTVGATAVLLLADQSIADGMVHLSRQIHLHTEEEYKSIWVIKSGRKEISLLKAPKNLNTALYQAGQGFPGLLIGAGLFTYGKIKKDYRALSTASQLAETFILMGAGTQILKRISGRQSPSNATVKGGVWHLLPSFKQFGNNTPEYDAFPSGHMATLISTVTVLAENYPEKRYIKPVGYSLSGLVALAMINNEVHWASDYPLAVALGYLCAKQVIKRSRKHVGAKSKTHNSLSLTLHSSMGRTLPGIVYRF